MKVRYDVVAHVGFEYEGIAAAVTGEDIVAGACNERVGVRGANDSLRDRRIRTADKNGRPARRRCDGRRIAAADVDVDLPSCNPGNRPGRGRLILEGKRRYVISRAQVSRRLKILARRPKTASSGPPASNWIKPKSFEPVAAPVIVTSVVFPLPAEALATSPLIAGRDRNPRRRMQGSSTSRPRSGNNSYVIQLRLSVVQLAQRRRCGRIVEDRWPRLSNAAPSALCAGCVAGFRLPAMGWLWTRPRKPPPEPMMQPPGRLSASHPLCPKKTQRLRWRDRSYRMSAPHTFAVSLRSTVSDQRVRSCYIVSEIVAEL